METVSFKRSIHVRRLEQLQEETIYREVQRLQIRSTENKCLKTINMDRNAFRLFTADSDKICKE